MYRFERIGNLGDIAPQQSFRDRHALSPFRLRSRHDNFGGSIEVFIQHSSGVGVKVVYQYQG